MSPELHIRPYRPADLDALYEICLATGAAGRGAAHLTAEPKLIGDVYAAPYALLEPEHAFVLDGGNGEAVGYVLGALDTVAFEAACEAEWWPALRLRHQPDSGQTELDRQLIALVHDRPSKPEELLETHPSHLHIDLLPEVQGLGWGRRLMDVVIAALRAKGSPGVHWGVSSRNTDALAFYRHIGACLLQSSDAAVTFGFALAGGTAATTRH